MYIYICIYMYIYIYIFVCYLLFQRLTFLLPLQCMTCLSRTGKKDLPIGLERNRTRTKDLSTRTRTRLGLDDLALILVVIGFQV